MLRIQYIWFKILTDMPFEKASILNQKGQQAIKIPKRMQIDDNKVYLKKVGNALFIIPFHSPWQNLLDSLDAFTPDFMNEREQPLIQKRESFD